MATSIGSILTIVRRQLVEPEPRFWSDAELIDILVLGVHDLWGAINDQYKEHFVTLDTTNVTMPANADHLAGIPADVFRIELIEPRDLTSSSSNVNLIFTHRDYRDPDFVSARAQDAQDPSNRTIYYTLFKPGAPVGAPVIKVGPKVNANVELSLLYVPTLPPLGKDDDNPIPGESDNALVAWTIAFARAKEREDRQPDPNWISIYSTEKGSLLTRLTPRQTQDAEYADALFQPYW